jgi:hypothetical protein
MSNYPELTHNLDPKEYMWLWAKYVTGYNAEKHCTSVLRGYYSKKLSGHNKDLPNTQVLVLDEQPVGDYAAIYICGVSKRGYRIKANYPHNLHTSILPLASTSDKFSFEGVSLNILNGRFLPIPSQEQLAPYDRERSEAHTSCRIYRWAVVTRPCGSKCKAIPR